MTTWHQEQYPVRLYHDSKWTVVIDPPNRMRALMTFVSRNLAEVYMRNLEANNPGVYPHSYILQPGTPQR